MKRLREGLKNNTSFQQLLFTVMKYFEVPERSMKEILRKSFP